jgi:hypothetical protein
LGAVQRRDHPKVLRRRHARGRCIVVLHRCEFGACEFHAGGELRQMSNRSHNLE